MRCDTCLKLVEGSTYHMDFHLDGDIIFCNSCYANRAFREFDDIYPIVDRFEILDL